MLRQVSIAIYFEKNLLWKAIIENLTFADVESEGVRSLADANLIKLCRLSQLCLEYLLHCQEVLER